MSITDPINYYQYNCDNINNTIDWNTFPNSGSADLPGVNGSFAFSLVFTKLYEYRDKGYTAAEGFDPRNLHNTSTYRDMPLSDLEWKFDSHSQVLQATTYNVSDNFTWCISVCYIFVLIYNLYIFRSMFLMTMADYLIFLKLSSLKILLHLILFLKSLTTRSQQIIQMV